MHTVIHSRLLAILFLLFFTPLAVQSVAQEQAEPVEKQEQMSTDSIEQRNKEIARNFYEDLWFTNNTDEYDKYVADEYVVHDIDERKNKTESAIQQKRIADFLHSQGKMSGTIDYQIAEGDLVATRWQWKMQPSSMLFRIMGGNNQVPIINVFRFKDGKIVEIWNHRHDIDAFQGNVEFVKGLAIGLFVALIGWIIAIYQWWKVR